MVVEQEAPLTFAGTKREQEIAQRMFAVMRGQGRFMSRNAPIRVSLESLSAFLVQETGAKAETVEKAVAANPDVFAFQEREGVRLVVTTMAGHIPIEQRESTLHSFAARMMTPAPKPERPAVAPRVRPLVDPSWTTFTIPADLDEAGFDEDEAVDELDAAPEAVVTPAVETDEVVAIPAQPEPVETPAIVEPAPVAAVVETPPADVEAEAEAEAEAATEPERAADVAAPVEPEVELVEEAAPAAPVTQVAQPVAPVTRPEPRQAPVAPPAPPKLSDVSGVADDALAAAIAARLSQDPRVAHFGDQWLSEDRVPRLSRGDLRRIKDYIDEQEQPLTDATLAQDILNVRANASDFELARFAVNIRLSREHRDFDFVGTNGQRFWSTNALPQIGTTRRRPNEIGTDYRYLVDEVDADVEPRSVRSIDHVLTFYEYTLGLLPLDADMQQLVPKALLPDQRSAVLTFECPQSYTTYLVELRYATPNRGGFLLGLDDFFSENLVPGAMISVTATENDGHYRLEYLAGDSQSVRLLELDDRRAVRYVFRPTSFACAVADELLISEERYPNLGSERPLDDKVRRRPEAVVHATFERIGIDSDQGKMATFDDLFAAVNIERPFSPHLLRTTLEHAASISTEDDGDTFVDGAGA